MGNEQAHLPSSTTHIPDYLNATKREPNTKHSQEHSTEATETKTAATRDPPSRHEGVTDGRRWSKDLDIHAYHGNLDDQSEARCRVLGGKGRETESDPEALGRLNLAGQDIQAKGWAHSDPGTARSGSHQASTRGIDRAGAGVVGEIVDACSAYIWGLDPAAAKIRQPKVRQSLSTTSRGEFPGTGKCPPTVVWRWCLLAALVRIHATVSTRQDSLEVLCSLGRDCKVRAHKLTKPDMMFNSPTTVRFRAGGESRCKRPQY